jgi:hypothetical protein
MNFIRRTLNWVLKGFTDTPDDTVQAEHKSLKEIRPYTDSKDSAWGEHTADWKEYDPLDAGVKMTKAIVTVEELRKEEQLYLILAKEAGEKARKLMLQNLQKKAPE